MEKFNQGFDKHLGYDVVHKTSSTSHIKLELKEHHKNVYGYVHGGVYYSLGDVASGYIVTENEGTWVTLNGSINYVKSTKSGILNCEARTISQSRNTMVIDVLITQEDVLLCKASYTMYRVKKERVE